MGHLDDLIRLSDERIANNGKFPIFIIALTSLLTRFYYIHEPAHVCWDETHFGKMASWYINRTFFFDVHPPLGKMLIALSGSLTGYNGTFAFEKPGDEYQHWNQYVGMRIFCGFLGMIIPIFIYSSTKSISRSQCSAIIATILVLFDNGLITLTRYILLDAPLLFFIAAAILGMSKFSYQLSHQLAPEKQFTWIWWFWLIWLGVSIACAFSVKFVGLFIVALVGLRTILDLWEILGDISRPISYFYKHFLARTICLIILPIFLYITIFYTHLSQLNHSGSGDGFYSSAFQSQLIGNSLHNSSWPAHLAYGAEITLKNNRIGGAYLHSHWHLYPEGVGARQQQVTTYSHKDSNNKWLIKKALDGKTTKSDEKKLDEDIDFVRDGDLVILEHINTKRNLHSHFEPAPITKRHYQVTCYGENGLGDANDIWIIKKESNSAMTTTKFEEKLDNRIYTVKSRFMLIHYITNCALHSHSRQLPKWAYDQLEVTCNPKLHHRDNYWNIEDNYYPILPNVSFEAYAPSFIERIIESHAVMLQGNSGLKPKEGEVTSRPWQWPLNYKGQFFSASKGQKVYLLGNPIIWWLNLICVPLAAIILLFLITMNKLKQTTNTQTTSEKVVQSDNSHEQQVKTTTKSKKARQTKGKRISPNEKSASEAGGLDYIESASWLLCGWAIHYLPFYFMGRVLYFHHYFPAFLFSCMLTGVTLDYSMSIISIGPSILSLASRKRETVILLSSIVIYTYLKFLPITYGFKTTIDQGSEASESTSKSMNVSSNQSHDEEDSQRLSSLKWLDSWEF